MALSTIDFLDQQIIRTMKRKNELIDEILSIGKPLHQFGINNWALKREDVIKILDTLFKNNISVLGGDVCEEIGVSIFPNGDSWYTEPKKGETHESFIIRSHEATKNYVNQYNEKSKTIYYILVCDGLANDS